MVVILICAFLLNIIISYLFIRKILIKNVDFFNTIDKEFRDNDEAIQTMLSDTIMWVKKEIEIINQKEKELENFKSEMTSKLEEINSKLIVMAKKVNKKNDLVGVNNDINNIKHSILNISNNINDKFSNIDRTIINLNAKDELLYNLFKNNK